MMDGVNTRTIRLHWPLLAILVATAASGWLFVVLASELLEGELAHIDELGRRLADSIRSPAADLLFGAATQLGSSLLLLVVCLFAAAGLHRRYAGRLVFPVVLSPVMASTLVQLLKTHFVRARPVSLGPVYGGYSFPSGHTTNATAVALTLVYIIVRERIGRRVHLLWAPCIALLVGASRVYLGAHWTSDVLGGWIAGAAIASACCLLYEYGSARHFSANPAADASRPRAPL
jgi:undecaprenyl-diphosphatase